MEKIDCINDYYLGIKAYYLFLLGSYSNQDELKEFILKDEYISASKMAFISSLLLSIKEELVLNKGNLEYESNLFGNLLEESISLIAKKEKDGYKIDDTLFKDASSLVAVIRNKIGHGDYSIDFINNQVILNYKEKTIKINISKLTTFIIDAFSKTLSNKKTNKYTREIVLLFKVEKNRVKNIKTKSELKNVIRSSKVINFSLETKDGSFIDSESMSVLDFFFKRYNLNPELVLEEDYQKLNNYFKSKNYKFDIKTKRINNQDLEDKIINNLEEDILNNPKIDYNGQIRIILEEVNRVLNLEYNKFNPVIAYTNNLFLLDAISKTKSVDSKVLGEYISSRYDFPLKIYYDAFGISLVGMFNVLFSYPLDDIYTSEGGYKVDRTNELDFSKLDLSLLKPNFLEIEEEPLETAFSRYNNLLKQKNELLKRQEKFKNNLLNVKKSNNQVAISKIEKMIIDLNILIKQVEKDLKIREDLYLKIKDDFNVNRKYHENKAIIVGIRNSIAHGNIEIIKDNEKIMDTKIIFKDIYEGKLTFELEVTLQEFSEFLDINSDILFEYFNKQKNKK